MQVMGFALLNPSYDYCSHKLAVVPANAGTHNPRQRLLLAAGNEQSASQMNHAVWVPGLRSLCSLARDDSHGFER